MNTYNVCHAYTTIINIVAPSNGKFLNQLSLKKYSLGGARYYHVEFIFCKMNVKLV